jgi:hypothetical protein
MKLAVQPNTFLQKEKKNSPGIGERNITRHMFNTSLTGDKGYLIPSLASLLGESGFHSQSAAERC